MQSAATHRVVIVGGGFGGLYAATSLRRAPVDVTLIDRRNFHLFQPLLYQVALGALSPANIAAPLRGILRHQKNARVLLGNVRAIDIKQRLVHADEEAIPYDSLIVATGAKHSYFARPDWEEQAPGLKTIEDATEIRRRVLLAFERAERLAEPSLVRKELTFLVIGAGPTGVELAGALAEIARHTLRYDFRSINPSEARVLLVEGTDRVLPSYASQLSQKAEASLRRLGVEIWTGTLVKEIEPGRVEVERGGVREEILASTVLWAAGVEASPLGRILAESAGVATDRAGRVLVEPDFSLHNHPEIFVIGDLAHQKDSHGNLLPGVAPVAMQAGRYVARSIEARLEGKTLPPFRYHDRGAMATIGRAAAVADLGWAKLSGMPAWMIWLFIHLLYLIQYQNRLLVLLQWAWSYFSWNRSARLITATKAFDPHESPIAAPPPTKEN